MFSSQNPGSWHKESRHVPQKKKYCAKYKSTSRNIYWWKSCHLEYLNLISAKSPEKSSDKDKYKNFHFTYILSII